MGWIENRNLGKDERRAKMKLRRLCESEWVHECAGADTISHECCMPGFKLTKEK